MILVMYGLLCCPNSNKCEMGYCKVLLTDNSEFLEQEMFGYIFVVT